MEDMEKKSSQYQKTKRTFLMLLCQIEGMLACKEQEWGRSKIWEDLPCPP